MNLRSAMIIAGALVVALMAGTASRLATLPPAAAVAPVRIVLQTAAPTAPVAPVAPVERD